MKTRKIINRLRFSSHQTVSFSNKTIYNLPHSRLNIIKQVQTPSLSYAICIINELYNNKMYNKKSKFFYASKTAKLIFNDICYCAATLLRDHFTLNSLYYSIYNQRPQKKEKNYNKSKNIYQSTLYKINWSSKEMRDQSVIPFCGIWKKNMLVVYHSFIWYSVQYQRLTTETDCTQRFKFSFFFLIFR